MLFSIDFSTEVIVVTESQVIQLSQTPNLFDSDWKDRNAILSKNKLLVVRELTQPNWKTVFCSCIFTEFRREESVVDSIDEYKIN